MSPRRRAHVSPGGRMPGGRPPREGPAGETTFARRVLAVVRRIPPGRVATYGDVAALAGRPRASRAVGNIMRNCTAPGVPCHRVVAAGGLLGGYGSNPDLKRALLRAEGLLVAARRIRDFAVQRWPAPGSTGAGPRTRRVRST